MPDGERKEAFFALTTRGQCGRQARVLSALVSNGWSVGGYGPYAGLALAEKSTFLSLDRSLRHTRCHCHHYQSSVGRAQTPVLLKTSMR